MCFHLLLILMSKKLWALAPTNPLLWQRAFTTYEIADLLSVCTNSFVSKPVTHAQESEQSDSDLKLTPLKAAQRDKALPQSTDGLFNVIRYIATEEPRCSHKQCTKKMKQYSICVSFKCLYQRRQQDKPRVSQLYCCLNLACLTGVRNTFTSDEPKFNHYFDRVPSDLSKDERASIDACIRTVPVSPSKRVYTTPNQSPSKRGRPSSRKTQTP
jgi:hypothetical protein